MANNIECLLNIIGITPKNCDCITEDLEIQNDDDSTDNDWYKKSESGFYLHELEGVVSITTVKDTVSCEKLSDYYKKLLLASINETADDISASINERYKKKESNFVGFVGSRTSGRSLGIPSGYAGLKLTVAQRKGAVLVLKGLGVIMNAASTFDVTIYRRYPETNLFEQVEVIEGVNANTNAYTINMFEENIILPMEIENEGYLEYYLLYPIGSFQPRDNLASCGCGTKEHQLSKLIAYGGVSGTVIEDMGNWNVNQYANGLVLDIEIRCNAEAMICQMYTRNADWAKYVQHAVLYKAAWKVQKTVLSSNNITQEVMANGEAVEANRSDFETEYYARIRYLVQNIDLSISDCYTCNNSKMRVGRILL